ncbi:hypothetical protein HY638_02880 [Candidatus Woesearchaeota archaeon]|nr:hypothetical protein [Candidatus Woesearchaeota archaeon]
MPLLYVCAAGSRRSPCFASYTMHYREEYGLQDLVVEFGTLFPEKLERDMLRRERRLEECQRYRNGIYSGEVEVLRQSPTTIHPRVGVILLKEGIDDFLEKKALIVSANTIGNETLVLATGNSVADRIRQTNPYGKVYTILEFLGLGEGDFPDAAYWLPFVGHKLEKDRELCDDIRSLSIDVLERLANRRLCSSDADAGVNYME